MNLFGLPDSSTRTMGDRDPYFDFFLKPWLIAWRGGLDIPPSNPAKY
jgi:hypothetical protein